MAVVDTMFVHTCLGMRNSIYLSQVLVNARLRGRIDLFESLLLFYEDNVSFIRNLFIKTSYESFIVLIFLYSFISNNSENLLDFRI